MRAENYRPSPWSRAICVRSRCGAVRPGDHLRTPSTAGPSSLPGRTEELGRLVHLVEQRRPHQDIRSGSRRWMGELPRRRSGADVLRDTTSMPHCSYLSKRASRSDHHGQGWVGSSNTAPSGTQVPDMPQELQPSGHCHLLKGAIQNFTAGLAQMRPTKRVSPGEIRVAPGRAANRPLIPGQHVRRGRGGAVRAAELPRWGRPAQPVELASAYVHRWQRRPVELCVGGHDSPL